MVKVAVLSGSPCVGVDFCFLSNIPFPLHALCGRSRSRRKGEGIDFVYMAVLDFLLVLVKYFGISFVHRLIEDGIFGDTGV